jgi:hypothetical protein
MAAPATATTLNFAGKWVMNKSMSDDSDKLLALQGMSWVTRKAISIATINITIKHYTDDQGIEHVDADQSIGGGLAGTKEERNLSDTPREHTDHIFGSIIGRSLRAKVADLEHEFLKKGWTEDTVEHGVLRSIAESNTEKSGKTWKADQVWGFEIINGERRYTRHVKFTGPKGEDLEVRLVYDYVGSA